MGQLVIVDLIHNNLVTKIYTNLFMRHRTSFHLPLTTSSKSQLKMVWPASSIFWHCQSNNQTSVYPYFIIHLFDLQRYIL